MDELTSDAKARIIAACIDGSRSGFRKAFMHDGNEVMKFAERHAGPENPEYEKEAYWGAKVTKTSEARQLFGNAIYQLNPSVGKFMKSIDPAAEAEADAFIAYQKQSLRESNGELHRKRAVDQSIVWGRGVVHTLLDEHGRTVSKFFPVKDFFQDPDALSADQVRWQGRRRYSQRSELQRRYPKKKNTIAKLTAIGKTVTDATNGKKANQYGDERAWSHDPCDMIEYYVCYFKVGLHNFKNGVRKDAYSKFDPKDIMPENAEVDNSAKRYVIAYGADNRAVILDEGAWDIPFWKDGSFPFSKLDLKNDDEGDWPLSILSAGMPWQRAITEITQRALAKTEFNMRDIIVILRNENVKFTDADIRKITHGNDVEVITPEALSQDADINKALKHFQFNQISSEFERTIQLCEHYFEKATGLNEIIYSGQGGSQFRNAAAANLAASASTSRIDAFRDTVEAWTAEITRKEAIASRALLDQEDIAKIIGPAKAQYWRRLVPPMEVLQEQLIAEMPELAMNPELMQQMIAAVMQGGVVFDEWLHEWSVEIVPGSAIRPSLQKQEQLAEWLMNQPFAAAMNAGKTDLAAELMAVAMEAHKVDPRIIQRVREAFTQPVMPQQMPA